MTLVQAVTQLMNELAEIGEGTYMPPSGHQKIRLKGLVDAETYLTVVSYLYQYKRVMDAKGGNKCVDIQST